MKAFLILVDNSATSALPGKHTISFTLSTGGNLSRGSGVVDVRGASGKPRRISCWDQYQIHKKGSPDCGPASVAIALSPYKKGPGVDAKGNAEIRDTMGAPGNVDTNDAQIKKGLLAYGAGVQLIDPGQDPGPRAQLSDLAIAIRHHEPVIVFIEAGALHRPPGGHCLVLAGFHDSNAEAFANLYDPDMNPVSGGVVTFTSLTRWRRGSARSTETAWWLRTRPETNGGPCHISLARS